MDDAQKSMEDRYNNRLLNDYGRPAVGVLGECERWLTPQEELSMDTAHACDDALCQLQLDHRRQHWLLGSGVDGGMKYEQAKWAGLSGMDM